MTDEEILQILAECVAEVLAIAPERVGPATSLMGELGADSLDLVELMYLVEDRFGIALSAQDMSLTAQLGLPEERLHQDERLTDEALALLRERFPHAGDLLVPGAQRRDLAVLITPLAVASTVRRKLAGGDPSGVA